MPHEKPVAVVSTTATVTDEPAPKRRKAETEVVDPPIVEYALWPPSPWTRVPTVEQLRDTAARS